MAIFIGANDLTTTDAGGQVISENLVGSALEGLTPHWAKMHSGQLKAWQRSYPAAIGILGVSIVTDDSVPRGTVQFYDSSSVRQADPDPEKGKDPRNDRVTTTMTMLAEIVNLAVPN